MTDLRKAAEQALGDLEDLHKNHGVTCASSMAALRAALAEPVEEQKKMTERIVVGADGRKYITHEPPPQRAEPEQPQKARPDFLAGYDAGLADGRRCAERDAQDARDAAIVAAALAEPDESAALRARIAGLEKRIEMIEAYNVRTWSDSFTLGDKP
jgi:hypothetical protein